MASNYDSPHEHTPLSRTHPLSRGPGNAEKHPLGIILVMLPSKRTYTYKHEGGRQHHSLTPPGYILFRALRRRSVIAPGWWGNYKGPCAANFLICTLIDPAGFWLSFGFLNFQNRTVRGGFFRIWWWRGRPARSTVRSRAVEVYRIAFENRERTAINRPKERNKKRAKMCWKWTPEGPPTERPHSTFCRSDKCRFSTKIGICIFKYTIR